MQRLTRSVPGILVLALSATGCVGPLGCTSSGDQDGAQVVSDAEAGELLINRNWIHRWPKSKDDRLHVYRFVPDMGGGVYQDRTLFLGFFELFQFEVARGAIRFHFPDMEERALSRFRIEHVDGPEPFDLRLTVQASPRGPTTYYGIRSETGATWKELDELLHKLAESTPD